MSRKDYILLAQALGDTVRRGGNATQILGAAHVIAEYLQRDNAQFQKGKFMDAVRTHAGLSYDK